jgi:hypothetical protein
MRLIQSFLFLCAALAALPSLATPLGDLYRVREPVTSQQPAERTEALQGAFDTLLLRLTGDPEAGRQPALGALRGDPQQLVGRYVYEDQAIVVDFDPATTERSLRAAGVSLWGADRPSVLGWWLNQSEDGAQLLGDDQQGAAALRAAAQHRGLPLRLPIADLEEQLSITADALKAERAPAAQAAAERYDADSLLTVVAQPTDAGWQADWQFWLGDAATRGQAKGDSQAAVADAVMLAVSRFLAPRYLVVGAVESITLEILGADVQRFAEVERLLEPLGGRLLRMGSDRLVYRLNVSPQQLKAQLALARLHEVPVEPEAPAIDASQGLAAEPSEPAAEAPAARPQTGLLLRYSW